MSIEIVSDKEINNIFEKEWDELSHRFRKIETLQHYNEEGSESYKALLEGELQRAVRLCRKEIASISNSDNGELGNKESDRIRIVDFPLNEYTVYEIHSYLVSSKELGDKFWLTDYESLEIPNRYVKYFGDFICFDEKISILYNYDIKGFRTGGIKMRSEKHIIMMIELFEHIKKKSERLRSFIENKNIDIIF